LSQARRRSTTSPIRWVSPGFIVTSRAMPLRLLSRPSTATRLAIGVSTGASAAACGGPAAGAAGFGAAVLSAGAGGAMIGGAFSFCNA